MEPQLGLYVRVGELLGQRCPTSGIKSSGSQTTRLQQVAIDSKGFLEFFDCPDVCLIRCCEVYITRTIFEVDIDGFDEKLSPSSAIGFKTPTDMLGFLGWLASIKQGMLEPVKVKCIFLRCREGIVDNKLWRLDEVTSKVLHGFEFEVEPLGDHTFKLAHDREQNLACELFGYREDSKEADFAVVAVDKIYAHESLTFNDTIPCEVISKWKTGLKEDMDFRSDVYVLSNSYRKSSDDNHDFTGSMHQAGIWVTKGLLVKAKGNVLGLEIIRDQSGNTLRDSLSGDCDVEKNSKWSYTYAVGSQEYQVVYTRPNIASSGVDMLDGFDCVIMEYLVKISKKARILELKRRNMKKTDSDI
ncbi:hypothetical protein Tco_0612578 [Tanacetum coccineum]